jgi:hypothetical protein
VPPVMSAVLVCLVVVDAGQCTLLCSGSETVVVPPESGCCVVSGGGSAVLAAVPGDRAGISGAEGRVPEAGAEAVPFGAE